MQKSNQKGITLIALIITIIVMLILVGVTVNIALTGGLFTKATDASKQMQVEAEKEELLSSVVAAIGYDGKVDLEEIQLPNGWKGTEGTYTSPKGNIYVVDENGKITESNINVWKKRGLTADLKFDTEYKSTTGMAIAFKLDGILYATTGSLTNEEIETGIQGTNEELSVIITSNALTVDYVSQQDFKIEVESNSKLSMYSRIDNSSEWNFLFYLETE